MPTYNLVITHHPTNKPLIHVDVTAIDLVSGQRVTQETDEGGFVKITTTNKARIVVHSSLEKEIFAMPGSAPCYGFVVSKDGLGTHSTPSAAVAAAVLAGGSQSVFICDGTYVDNIVYTNNDASKNLEIVGASRDGVIIAPTSGSPFTDNSSVSPSRFQMRDLTLSAPVSAHAFHLDGGGTQRKGYEFSRVTFTCFSSSTSCIKGFGHSLDSWNFHRCKFSGGGLINGDALSRITIDGFEWNQCDFTSLGNGGFSASVRRVIARGVNFNGGNFDIGTIDFWSPDGPCSSIVFNGVVSTTAGGRFIFCNLAQNWKSITVSGSSFQRLGGANNILLFNSFSINRCEGLIISGNTFLDGTSSPQCAIDGNTDYLDVIDGPNVYPGFSCGSGFSSPQAGDHVVGFYDFGTEPEAGFANGNALAFGGWVEVQ